MHQLKYIYNVAYVGLCNLLASEGGMIASGIGGFAMGDAIGIDNDSPKFFVYYYYVRFYSKV